MSVDVTESLASILASVAEHESLGTRYPDSLRVSVVRNFAAETLVPLLKHACHRSRLTPEILVGDYDNIAQELLQPESPIYQHHPDIILVSWVLEHVDPRCAAAGWTEGRAVEFVQTVLQAAVTNSRAVVVVNTFLPPMHTEAGLLAGHDPGHRVARVHALNQAIRAFAAAHAGQVFVIDSERLVRLIGEDQAIDRRFWYMFRSPFKKAFLSLYAGQVARVGRSLKGRARKVLVLDCDNTLWGGIIGEDGLDGIRLDAHEYPGRCFAAFQQSVLNLVAQGIVVALCSKNEEADVWSVIDQHPHCLLRREHIAAWRINWQPKSENLLDLARELNLGIDSFVFVDDSAVECDLVRQALPDVEVLQVPPNPYDLPDLIHRDGLFDVLAVSAEDRSRTAMYAAERERRGLRQAAVTAEEFLVGLGVTATVHPATAAELPRVAQLVSKTNQFNLTTLRHTEAALRSWMGGSDSEVFTLTATDRFGDLGLVGVLVAFRDGDAGVIDSLLLSCRALGRKLELAFVHEALDALDRRWGVREWRASYRPTPKNRQVAEFWDDVGLDRLSDGSADVVTYALPAGNRQRPDLSFITLSS